MDDPKTETNDSNKKKIDHGLETIRWLPCISSKMRDSTRKNRMQPSSRGRQGWSGVGGGGGGGEVLGKRYFERGGGGVGDDNHCGGSYVCTAIQEGGGRAGRGGGCTP